MKTSRHIFMYLLTPTMLIAQATFDLQRAFEGASKSVVVVHSINLRGEEVALGSGIVVASGEIVTNAHVVLNGAGAFLTKGTERWEVKGIFLDPKLDLALLKTDPLPLPEVKLRNSAFVKPGQKLFAIGNPHGLELSLSDGVVSAVRVIDQTTYIQTTAPISPGSSGGGIFNTKKELVGLTTFMLKDGQNLNFAISSDYIPSLRVVNTELKIMKSKKLIQAEDKFIDIVKIGDMSNSQMIEYAKNGSALAQWQLGLRFSSGSDRVDGKWVTKDRDSYRASYWLNKAAESGSDLAASMLVHSYLNDSPGFQVDGLEKDLSAAKRLARQMIKIIDNNYNVLTNKPFTKTQLRSSMMLASQTLFIVNFEIGLGDQSSEVAMETLVWGEIMAKLMEEDLAQKMPTEGSSFSHSMEDREKGWIKNRNTEFEFERNRRGLGFVEDARTRAEALMRGYGILD